MQLTLKKDKINVKSLITKHDILQKSSALVTGREGVLETEKELYLIVAFVDTFIEENLIELCNEDTRSLNDIMVEDIEPVYFKLMEEEEYKELYSEVKKLYFARCKEIWDNQHSIMSVIDAILTTIATMSDEDKKEALIETGKMAEKAFERRTEVMSDKVDAANSKLEQFIKQYTENIKEEKIEESSAE